MVAVAREGLKDKYPLGSALVVQHVETAADAYEELTALLPNQIAVWTSEHDADNADAKRKPRFTVGELEDYPIIIFIHEFFRNVRGRRHAFTAAMTWPSRAWLRSSMRRSSRSKSTTLSSPTSQGSGTHLVVVPYDTLQLEMCYQSMSHRTAC